jgi:hypothetical protein
VIWLYLASIGHNRESALLTIVIAELKFRADFVEAANNPAFED